MRSFSPNEVSLILSLASFTSKRVAREGRTDTDVVFQFTPDKVDFECSFSIYPGLSILATTPWAGSSLGKAAFSVLLEHSEGAFSDRTAANGKLNAL